MKNIKDIASGDKFVQWETLAGPIDDNFTELEQGKLSKNDLAQSTGDSTTTAMSQDAVTKELNKKPGKIVSPYGEVFNHESNKVAGGVNNHAEGQGTDCSGSCNHAEGRDTKAYAIAAHAEGDGAIAAADASHAEGAGTATATKSAHVEGSYNYVTDSIHIVGGGTSEDERKNLHEIRSDGRQYMMGIGGYNGTNRDGSKSVDEVISGIDTSKLNKSDLAQSTGISTTTAMSQDATTKALAGLLPGQKASDTPFITKYISDGNSEQIWEEFNRGLDGASNANAADINGVIRYYLSGLRVDVVNRFVDSSSGSSRRLTQTVTGNISVDSDGNLALNGDVERSYWRLYANEKWGDWTFAESDIIGIYPTTLDIRGISGQATEAQVKELESMIEAINNRMICTLGTGTKGTNPETLILSVTLNEDLDTKTYYVKGISTKGIVYSASCTVYVDIWEGNTYGEWTSNQIDLSSISEGITVEARGLTSLITLGSATADDIVRVFGTKNFDELKAKFNSKLIIDPSGEITGLYAFSAFGKQSIIGNIIISRIGMQAVNSNNYGYVNLAYSLGSLSNVTVGTSTYIEDAPSDGNIYGRKNKKWELIQSISDKLYRTPGPLSSISASTEAPDLITILGPAQDFISAASSGRPIASQQESDGVNEIFCYIPISYRYNVDYNTCSLSYLIGTELYSFDLDLSDGYGDITNFKKKDLAV